MGKAAKQTRENRTITVDFRDEATCALPARLAASPERLAVWHQRGTHGTGNGLLGMLYRPGQKGHMLLELRYRVVCCRQKILRCRKGCFIIPGEPKGVSARARASVQPGPVSTARPARWPMWGRSGRWARTHRRLDAQPANSHLGRLSMTG
jgi:hypothetical protein